MKTRGKSNVTTKIVLTIVMGLYCGASLIAQVNSENHGAKMVYTGSFTVYGDADKYYPVAFMYGDQDNINHINIFRRYSDAGPETGVFSGVVHKGGLSLEVTANYGSWGGAVYDWKIQELRQKYHETFAGGVAGFAYGQAFILYLRGGGFVYQFESEKPTQLSIGYNTGTLLYDTSDDAYDVYFPAPKSEPDYQNINAHRTGAGAYFNTDTESPLGLGTSAPDSKLHIKGVTTVESSDGEGSDAMVSWRSSQTELDHLRISIDEDGGEDAIFSTSEDGTAWNWRMQFLEDRVHMHDELTVAQNMGIGTADPAHKLHLRTASDNSGLVFKAEQPDSRWIGMGHGFKEGDSYFTTIPDSTMWLGSRASNWATGGLALVSGGGSSNHLMSGISFWVGDQDAPEKRMLLHKKNGYLGVGELGEMDEDPASAFHLIGEMTVESTQGSGSDASIRLRSSETDEAHFQLSIDESLGGIGVFASRGTIPGDNEVKLRRRMEFLNDGRLRPFNNIDMRGDIGDKKLTMTPTGNNAYFQLISHVSDKSMTMRGLHGGYLKMHNTSEFSFGKNFYGKVGQIHVSADVASWAGRFDNNNIDGNGIAVHAGKKNDFVTAIMHLRSSETDGSHVEAMVVKSTGLVGIGTTVLDPSFKLSVNGAIKARELKITDLGWSDFVFDDDYELRTLEEVEDFIEKEGHLPDVPSAAEVEENGIMAGEMDATLLQKVEELTLYVIQLNKEVEALKQENAALKEAGK